ncbi:MAG TPA: two-component regulator propeller domain-containing protein [Ohtaekwangia sp.]|nr:two-component regulator propeller domain-containing protein [Ohtaekwangia sp.]
MRAAFLLVLGLILTDLQGQKFNYSLRNFKAIDGLPQSQVKAMVEDGNGYLWVGTEGGGIARFDGRDFKVYTTLDGLQSNTVNYLLLDKKQNLWVVHPRGITKFDGLNFRKFEQPGSRASATRIRRIFEFGDSIFFMSAPGHIGKIHNDSVYYWSQPILPAKDGNREPLIIFARMTRDGTFYFGLNKQTLLVRRAGQEDFFIDLTNRFNRIYSVFERNGELWMTTDAGHLSVDLARRDLISRELPIKNSIILHDSIHDVYWTTIRGDILLKERITNGEVQTDTVLHEMGVLDILVDSEGNTWLGSNGAGLFKYFVQDFDRCASPNLTYIVSIHNDKDGATWIGSALKGLYKIRKGKVSTYDMPPNTRGRGVYYVTESPDGTLYAGGVAGLGKYDRNSDSFQWRAFPVGGFSPGILNIQFDDSGGMWLATGGGGIVYTKGDEVKRYTVDDGLNTNLIMTLLYSTYYRKVFVGDEFGLFEITDGQVKQVNIEGLENTSVLALHPFRDSLILASTGGAGIVAYNPKTTVRKFITTKDGLASDFIYFTAPDPDGYLWVGSEKGITRIVVDERLQVTEQIHYDYDNGLTGVETNQNAFCIFDDEKYFGLVDGIYSFNHYEREQDEPFKLHLTSVELFYGEFSAHRYAEGKSGFFNIPVNLKLPPDKNHITFKFNKVDKRNPKSVKFKYFLQGFDKTWSPPSSNSEVTYSNLPPGEYTFMVMSTGFEGNWEESVFSYNFLIETPFYARTSFMIGVMVFLGILVTTILYLRVRQRVRHMLMMERVRLKEQENVRKDIARDFHDEMGNQLTRIINYISLLKMNGTDRQHHADLYGKVEQSAKYLYTGTRDFIWSIDPSNDELSRLFIHIRDFGEKLFDEKGISFRAVNKVRDTVRLPYGFSREANLIFKEAMTNAFKYSHAGNVTLALQQVADDEFRLCLEDDGVGYDPCKIESPERGMRNMRERAEKINVRLEIESAPGKGTVISIYFRKLKKLHYGIAIQKKSADS